MKRAHEDLIESVLDYLFPDGMSQKSEEEKLKWLNLADEVARQIDERFGLKEVLEK